MASLRTEHPDWRGVVDLDGVRREGSRVSGDGDEAGVKADLTRLRRLRKRATRRTEAALRRGVVLLLEVEDDLIAGVRGLPRS